MTGSIATGRTRLVIEWHNESKFKYRIEADVVNNWGARPKPGAVWVLQVGIAHDPTGERLRELAQSLAPDAFLHFDGPRADWPYLERGTE